MRTRTADSRIWGSAIPDLTVKPIALQEPTEPEYDEPDDDSLFHKTGYEACKARKERYRVKVAKYEQPEKVGGDLITFIQDTITAHNVMFIQKKEPHQWEVLGALKRRLAPVMRRAVLSEQKYHKL